MIFPVDIAVANLYSIEAELIPRQAIKQALDWGSGETLTSPDPILSGRAKLSEHSDISASARDQAKAKSETPADSLSIAQTKAFPICPACGEETNPRPVIPCLKHSCGPANWARYQGSLLARLVELAERFDRRERGV